MCFLSFIVLAQIIKMKETKIEFVKIWLKPYSVRDIEVFLSITNFYYQSIENFNKITILFISIRKMVIAMTNIKKPNIASKISKKDDDGNNGNDNNIEIGRIELSKGKNLTKLNLDKSKNLKMKIVIIT